MIEFLDFTAIIVFWVLGGQIRGRLRDVPIPIILAFYCAFSLHSWVAFLTGASANIIRLGYGRYDPNDPKPSFLATIIHDSNGWWIRLAYGLICGIIVPIFVFPHLGVVRYGFYIIINSMAGFVASRLRLGVFITDILVAGAIGSIIWLI